MQTESYYEMIKAVNNRTQTIEDFTLKYGMDYTSFCNTFHQLPQPLFEKEEDSSEWNAELIHREILLQRMSLS